MRIYVGNLPYTTSETELRDLFGPSGAVESVTVIMDRDSGRSKGFGFVEMPNRDEATKAINELNGTEVGGRRIIVNEAHPRPPRDNYGDGGGGGGGGFDRPRRRY